MAINTANNQANLQSWAGGNCPAPAVVPQTIVVQAEADSCSNAPGCPAPTQQPTILDGDNMFGSGGCQILMCITNAGLTAVPLIFGGNAFPGSYQRYPDLVASAVDNSLVDSCDTAFAAFPDAAPSIYRLNELLQSRGLFLNDFFVRVNGGEAAAVTLQSNERLGRYQRYWPFDANCNAVQYEPRCVARCNGSDLAAGNIQIDFAGPHYLDPFNFLRYSLRGGVTVEIGLCVSGQTKNVTSYPC